MNGKNKKKQYLWLCVTKDRFELPVAVADSSTELAKMLGVNRRTILGSVSRASKGTVKRSRYMRIEIDEEN